MLIALFNAIVKIYEVSKLKKNYHYWWIVQLFILRIKLELVNSGPSSFCSLLVK